MRKYEFTWDLLGDVEAGRPNLGSSTRIEVYRLMQFAIRDVLERAMGTEKADEIFYNAGKLAGMELYDHYLTGAASFPELVTNIQATMKDLKIGIFRVEKSSLDTLEFTLTVGEDLDCSGLPELDYEVCIYDEGLIAGILERYTGKAFKVKEVDCWCTGDRTCRFTAQPVL
ncbi:MAG: 4-vinyl reductase [Syntrophobacterales bacterium]|jgi:predicted hydrocarbon binding protein|nr:4-vinyl reductase [Syntrophobacterales bacterium]